MSFRLFLIIQTTQVIELWLMFSSSSCIEYKLFQSMLENQYQICRKPGRVAQLVGHLTRKSGVLGSTPGLATYFRFSFRFFKKGSCQLLAKVCAGSTG